MRYRFWGMKDLKGYRKTIVTKNNREVLLRPPRKDDADGLLRFINELVGEETYILIEKRVSRKEEIAYLDERLKEMREKRGFNLLAVYRGRILANGNVSRGIGRQSHVGDLGVSVVKDFRDEELGSLIMMELLGLAKRWLGLKLISLGCFENNARALHVYRKAGFAEAGKIPKAIFYKGEYLADVMMCLDLQQWEPK